MKISNEQKNNLTVLFLIIMISRPGRSQGLSTITSVTYSFIDYYFVKISLRRCHALMGQDGAGSHKRDYVTIFQEILNPEGGVQHYWFKSYGDFAE